MPPSRRFRPEGEWEPAINLIGACMIWVAKAAGKVGYGFYHKAAIKIAGKYFFS